MRLVAMLALLGGCRDHEASCRAAIDEHRLAKPQLDHAHLEARCVRERWSDSRIRCELNNRGLVGLFCGDE